MMDFNNRELIRKALPFIGVGAVIAVVIAKNYSQTREWEKQFATHKKMTTLGLEGQVQELQSQIDLLAAQVNATDGKNIHDVMEPLIPPHIKNGGVRANVDFLYWRADEDGLEYGTKMIADPLIGASSKNKTKLLDMHFEWDPGFRLGIGYLFSHCDYWALDLNWTHINNEAHGDSSAKGIESQTGDTNTIISPWVNLLFSLRSGASKAKAEWKLDFNTLDLDLSRSLFVTKRVVFNPHIGFRGAWIDQHYRVKYKTHFLSAEDSPVTTRNVTFRAKNDYSGFGVRAGSDFLWHLSRHWNLFGEFSASILYGEFEVKLKNLHDQGLGEGDVPPFPLDFFARERFWRARANFEEAIGLSWETVFNRERFHVTVNAAYELSQWLNQNQLFYTFYLRGQDTISSVPIRNGGDLSFHGIRLGIQLDF